ncbi:MAG: prolipoprotein diacylglyceryl transferase [Flavobacteriaceae bacterium]|nr:prolipoprotein diacylglyceryl transferase [Flavobacteriaceae bacterium]
MLHLTIDWNLSPELFKIGSLSIRYYGLMFVVAFLLGIQIMKKIYKNEGVPIEYVDSLFMYVVIATLLGARLGDVFFYSWDSYKNNLIEILLPIAKSPNGSILGIIKGYEFVGFRGLASHGAAIGVVVAMFLYRRKYKYKSLLWILDRIVIGVASGAVFVRIGNLMNSEIIGKVTDSAIGFRFIRNDIGQREAMQITGADSYEKAYGLIENSSNYQQVLESIPFRYPTQIFESLSYAGVFLILWFIYWKTDKKDKPGFLFGMFMLLLWTVRFFVEFLKEAQVADREDWVLGLNTGQLLSIPMIAVGLYFVFRKTLKEKA